MYHAIAVANYFLEIPNSVDAEMTPMKIQKLVYVSHGWHLGIRGKPLVFDPVEAWMWGPVIRSVYDEFKKFGGNPITELGSMHEPTKRGTKFYIPRIDEQDQHTRHFLDEVWRVYGVYTGVQLSNLTHEEGTPWHQVWHNKDGKKRRGVVIQNEIIENYYANFGSQQ